MNTISNLEYTYLVTGPYAEAHVPTYLSSLAARPQLSTFDVQSKTTILLEDGKGKIGLTTPPEYVRLIHMPYFPKLTCVKA
jgi:hypothetical protein